MSCPLAGCNSLSPVLLLWELALWIIQPFIHCPALWNFTLYICRDPKQNCGSLFLQKSFSAKFSGILQCNFQPSYPCRLDSNRGTSSIWGFWVLLSVQTLHLQPRKDLVICLSPVYNYEVNGHYSAVIFVVAVVCLFRGRTRKALLCTLAVLL